MEPNNIDDLSYCTKIDSPVAPNSISYDITLGGGAVSARTFMSVWTKSTVSADNFKTATSTVSFKLGSSDLPTQFTATGMNAVWTTGSQMIKFDYLKA